MDSTERMLPGISLESTRLVEMLRDRKVGDQVAYADLSAKIGRNVQTVGHGNLATALRILAREHSHSWGTIRGVGLKRLDSVETLDSAKERTRRAGRQIFRARKVLGLVEYASLPIDKKREHDALAVLTGVARTALSTQKMAQVAGTLPGNAVLPTRQDVLRLIYQGEKD